MSNSSYSRSAGPFPSQLYANNTGAEGSRRGRLPPDLQSSASDVGKKRLPRSALTRSDHLRLSQLNCSLMAQNPDAASAAVLLHTETNAFGEGQRRSAGGANAGQVLSST